MISIDQINAMHPILASKSPRRQHLLKDLGIHFDVISEEVEEIYPSTMNVYEVPEYLARLKLAHLPEKFPHRLIICADTVVLLNDELLGKPNDENHAIEMLQKLSGQKHTVVSGLALAYQHKIYSFSETTYVHFRSLSLDEITYYIQLYKPFDKAGSYGVQEWLGYVGIKKIDGCYYNVMGMPISALFDYLSKNVDIRSIESFGG